MTANEPHARIGEIVEASTTEFTAQCYRLYDAPTIGSLVLCSEQTPVYGVVCEATTQSIDPGVPLYRADWTPPRRQRYSATTLRLNAFCLRSFAQSSLVTKTEILSGVILLLTHPTSTHSCESAIGMRWASSAVRTNFSTYC